MVEDPPVDAADQKVGPCLPVEGWPHVVLVPSRAGQAGLPSLHPFQEKLASFALQVSIEMGRMDVIGRQLLHWRGLGNDVEGKPVGCVPDRDRFHEGTGREVAVADGAHARTFDGGAGRAGDSELEDPVLRRGKIGKADHVDPDFLGRGLDDHLGTNREKRSFGNDFFFEAHEEKGSEQRGQGTGCGGWPHSGSDSPTQPPTAAMGKAMGAAMNRQRIPSRAKRRRRRKEKARDNPATR